MRKWFRNIYLTNRFFGALAVLILGFLLSYQFQNLTQALVWLFYLLVVLFLSDLLLLFASKGRLVARRLLPDKLSNGDDNPIDLQVENRYQFPVGLRIIDELPFQFQVRDFLKHATLKPGASLQSRYTVRPVKRGVYSFGSLNLFASSPIGLLRRRFVFDQNKDTAVYPSFLQLRKFDLMAFTNRLQEMGLKKIRRIGHTMEFEQIKEYVKGDDIRNINWKATAKMHQLMVNQYQDEKSQPVYSVVDKGRVMQMPFNELSLLDYAINSTLVISNVALKKQDKAGMFSFSRKVENRVVAQRRASQMNLIMETLYNLDTDFAESDFRRLYVDIKRYIPQRSLLLLYTNFETLDALHRQLPYLQAINRQHLLVVIFFENSELHEFITQPANNTLEVFQQTIAEKFVYEKKLIVNELKKFGIQAVLTRPENLTVNTLNKYLEIKARNLL